MNLDLDNVIKAKIAISKYFSGSYPEMVKNPVLLLNYLFQHSYICRPVFTPIVEQQNPPNHIVACIVNGGEAIGSGSSKKAARTQAAQKILSMIQDCNDNLPDTTVEKNELKPVESDFENSYSQIYTKSVMTRSEGSISFDGCVENSSSLLPSDLPSNGLIQPQWEGETKLGRDSSLKRSLPYSESFKTEEAFSPKIGSEKDQSGSLTNKSGIIMSLDEYFDPYFHLRKHSSQASDKSNSSSDVENFNPSQNLTEITNDEVASKPQANEPKTKSKSIRKTETKRAKFSNNTPSYFLDSYFDPFFRLKPVKDNADRDNSRINVSVTNTPIDEVCKDLEKVKPDTSITSEVEVSKMEKAKSPFAILQEKSIKNLKLIPRCSMERDGEGFKCKLVLDSFSSEGAGQSKKVAKINAAISLLNQLDERS